MAAFLPHILTRPQMPSVAPQKRTMHYIVRYAQEYLEAAREIYQQQSPMLATLHAVIFRKIFKTHAFQIFIMPGISTIKKGVYLNDCALPDV